jgi:MSHA biogenesis protein MshQ
VKLYLALNHKQFRAYFLLSQLILFTWVSVAQASIVYTGQSSGYNATLPTNGSAGSLTITTPSGTVAGQALIASIAARPHGMTVTTPPGWSLMTNTEQTSGGVSTAPGGMTLLTYYRIVGLNEPPNYTWAFANPVVNQGGSAVGGILAFSGIDTSAGNPINVWSQHLTSNSRTHSTTSIAPTLPETMIVSSISFLSASNFSNPTGIAGIIERLDQSAPLSSNAIGTTIQMATTMQPSPGVTGSSSATAAAYSDTGVGHLMALKPALIDPAISMSRGGPLVPGSQEDYSITISNLGIQQDPGPVTVVNTLPNGLSYNSFNGPGWSLLTQAGQTLTFQYSSPIPAGGVAPDLVVTADVNPGASGTLTNTATVFNTAGDGNSFNNTVSDSYLLEVDLALSLIRNGGNPGQTAVYTVEATNSGSLPDTGPISVYAALDPDMTYVSGVGANWTCAVSGQNLTCIHPDPLAHDGTRAFDLTVGIATTATDLNLSATLAGTSIDNDPSNNSDTDNYSFSSDLSMSISRSGDLVPGNNADYLLTVTNNGPNSSPQPVTVTNTLTPGLSYVSYSGSGWSCSVAGRSLTCARTTPLPDGASASIDITAAVAVDAGGTLTSTATVSGPATDPIPSNNSDSNTFILAGIGAFCETFETDLSDWTIDNSGGGDISIDPNYYQSGNQGIRIRWNDVTATSIPHDTSATSGNITYWIKRGVDAFGSEDPDTGENLYVEYLNSSGSWIQLGLYTGSGSEGEEFTESFPIPANAKHANFQIRLRRINGDGSDNDYFHADNICVGMSPPTPPPYAYYAFDEESWNGTNEEVIDGLGSLQNNGTAIGNITTTDESTTFGHDCRAAVLPSNTTAGAIEAVDTSVDINDIGTKGTIAFWYKSNERWNGNRGDRQLFDASRGNKFFFLTLRSSSSNNGRLVFGLEDTNDNDQTAQTGTKSFAANQWVHIATTWNLSTDRMEIYINGTREANQSINSNGSLGNMDTLYIGDNRSNYFTSGSSPNSANGTIDEVYIFDTALTSTDINATMNNSHLCPIGGPDHYELSLPSSSINCVPTPVTITACADASSPCTNAYTTANGETAEITTSAGMLDSTTLIFNATGIANTMLRHPNALNAASVSVALSNESLSAINPRICCPDGINCNTDSSCLTVFNQAGFIFTDSLSGSPANIAPQEAGTDSATYYLRAVLSDEATGACTAALNGTNSIDIGYECNDPTTCYPSNLMILDGGTATTIARNNDGNVVNYLPVSLTFDANGNAPFKLNYNDVGLTTLHATTILTDTQTVAAATLYGSSNAFVTRPAAFELSIAGNPGSVDAFDLNFFKKAGELFDIEVKAVTSSGSATPSYGKESSPESVKLTNSLVSPTGGDNPPLNGLFNAFGTNCSGNAEAGVACGQFSWDEVGIIDLLPHVSDNNYLGSGNVSGPPSGNVGRFIPHSFQSVPGLIFSGILADADGTFSYYGHEINGYNSRPMFTIEALSANGNRTKNYHGDFFKLTAGDLIINNPLFDNILTTQSITINRSTASLTSNNDGTALYQFGHDGITYDRSILPVAPLTTPQFDFTLVQISDNDTTSTMSELIPVNGGTEFRYGQLVIENNFGPETEPVTLEMHTEYWDGTNWLLNTSDASSTFTYTKVEDSTDLTSTEDEAGAAVTPGASNLSILVGMGTISLTPATDPLDPGGTIDITPELPDWLKSDWDDDPATPDNNPTATATFGIYRGRDRIISWEEIPVH